MLRFSWVFVVLLAVAALFFFYRRRSGDMSFWDAVRDPDRFDRHVAHGLTVKESVDALSAELKGNPTKIASTIDHYVFHSEDETFASEEFEALDTVGREIHPHLFELLQNNDEDKLTQTRASTFGLQTAPICRLCELTRLGGEVPREVLLALAPYLASDVSEIRSSIAGALASTGDAQWLPKLEEQMRGDDEFVGDSILSGFRFAATEDRIESELVPRIYDLVSASLGDDDLEDVPETLLDLNSKKAMAQLMDPSYFHVDSRVMAKFLDAANERSLMVPRDQLIATIESLKDGDDLSYPRGKILRECLVALALHQNESDLPLLEGVAANHKEASISRAAQRALKKFQPSGDSLWKRLSDEGWDGLTKEEQHIVAVRTLDSEVRNGGFAQYFFNSSGDNWKSAQAGLAACKASEFKEILDAAVEKFPDSQPPEENRKRRDALAKIARSSDPFEEQNSAWYAAETNIDGLLFQYERSARSQ